ncbi:hypothetical protein [Allocoleopsis sp.]|uniref:hypothetical protein n=1 Tax=Allocoleopsis sp. TaxID=3088169 RepID=UPI002FD19178
MVAGSALLLGAGLGYFVRIPQRAIAAIMALGIMLQQTALKYTATGIAQALLATSPYICPTDRNGDG